MKVADLQLIWGLAGAREKFEDMVSQLIHVEKPDSQRIRIVRGDGGLDSFVGELTGPDGIDVFQIKYFPRKIDEAQKGQIRESFNTVRSKKFNVKSWTLCLPIDFSIEETKWFEDWKAKQKDCNIQIRQPWGALHIETLLLQEKNRTIRDTFFREENTLLLREQLSILNELKRQGSRNLTVSVSPVWNRRELQAQLRLFNNGKGAIYITSSLVTWGAVGKRGGCESVQTIQGKLPIRLEEHNAADLLIHIPCDAEDLSVIGVLDGDRNRWCATDENMILFKHDAKTHRLPGTDKPEEPPSTEGLRMSVKAVATRLSGEAHDLIAFFLTNESVRPVSVHSVELGWAYTPPRQKPKFPGQPSVAEAGLRVGLFQQSNTNPLSPGERAVFVLEKEMSIALVEIVRGDVLDEDIFLEFVTDEKLSWRATMDEIPSVVRAVANSVLDSLRR